MNPLLLPVIPVMDLLNGRVVRAVAGDRANYRPVVSRLAPPGASAGAIAANLLAAAGSSELYIADLDAIRGGAVQAEMMGEIAATGAMLLADVGLRRPPLPVAPRGTRWVVGTETWAEPAELPTGPLTLSLDMRGGELLASAAWIERPQVYDSAGTAPSGPLPPGGGGLGWGGGPQRDEASRGSTPLSLSGPPPHPSPPPPGGRGPESVGRALEVVRRALAVADLAEVIVLDLAQVGVGGQSTLGLIGGVRRLLPTGVRLIAGGGVRGADDLAALRDAGADAAVCRRPNSTSSRASAA